MTKSGVSADLIIDKMLALSNISLTKSQREKFSKQIPEILKFAEVISKIDTQGVEPMYSMDHSELQLHDDIPSESFSTDEALGSSSSVENSSFKVPKVL